MSLRITLRDTETGELITHALAEHGNYATICGCSDDDDQFEPAPTAGKIDCDSCRAIYDQCKYLRAREFSVGRTIP
jgi:hypothetical protein